MMKRKLKVLAYIFKDERKKVLVFDHRGMPEAGVQIAGGTVEPGEDFLDALVREIKEESGLRIDKHLLKALGETDYKRKDREEINHRHYFAIDLDSLPDRWAHTVVSDGEDNGLIFDFYWLAVSDAKAVLTGNFGELL